MLLSFFLSFCLSSPLYVCSGCPYFSVHASPAAPASLCLPRRIEYCQTADEFYSTMGCLTQEMLEHSLIDSTELMQVGHKQKHPYLCEPFKIHF